MATTVTENRTFDKKMQKLFFKNPVKCQLLQNFREIIQLWSSLNIMVNDSNFHQTWLPLLLKIESLTKKNTNVYKKILKNSVKCQLLANVGFGWSLFTFDDLACSIFKMVINIEGWFILDVMENMIGNTIFSTRWAIQAHLSL
jgi:hypothetical protein